MSLVQNLKLDYDGFKVAIDRWEILDRDVTALWGPSGAGKTSIFRNLIGLENPSQPFSWNFDGVDLARVPVPERRIGVVFQSYELFPHMTSLENIRFASEARKINTDQARQHIDELVQVLGLSECLNRKALSLSGGERQRVALARALAGRPRILFLDEPFSALDSELRNEARLLVARAIKHESIPAVLVTHDLDDLRAFSGKITELKSGRIVGERPIVHSGH